MHLTNIALRRHERELRQLHFLSGYLDVIVTEGS
jgi:hypothetical protein